jgi:hypothetical protein
MRNRLLSTLALAGVLLAASPAFAQRQPGGRGGGMGGPTMYLSAKSVQEELKLTEDDAKKLTDELGKLDRNLSPEERREKTNKILTDGLKPEQLKRLNQIMWQRSGIARHQQLRGADRPQARRQAKGKVQEHRGRESEGDA